MSYSPAEQIFAAARGQVPSESDWAEIRQILSTMERAGFAVDDASNTPFVTMVAWVWARVTTRADVLALLRAAADDARQAETSMAEQLGRGQREILAMLERPAGVEVDPGAIAQAVHAMLRNQPPQTVKVDLSAVKLALRESFTSLWLLGAGLALALAFWLGARWGAHAPDAALKQQITDSRQQAAAPHAEPRSPSR